MPKREKTPSPGPDEPKFLSIYYPYPPYVTLEEEKDTLNCARWLSCFIGKDNLYAMFHKPSSPNTIIVEISNELTDAKMRNILGLHDWDEVFVTYDKEEGITYSKVLYSTFRTRREVEKTGWKIVEVQDEWFKGFNPAKGKKVTYPYPPTTFCEPPSLAEEVSALVLFRYLPADIFPEARRRPAITETKSAPTAPAAPQARVVPGSGGVVAGASNTGGKGKKKKGQGGGNGGVDPTVRQAAPLTRPAEASAKAKAIHNQTAKMTFKAYEEDSDDDDVGYYQSQTDDFGPDPSEDKGNPDKEVEQLEKEMKNAKIKGDARAASAPAQQYTPLFFNKPKEDDDAPLCPDHKKRCKPGICEWAAQQRRLRKQRENRAGGTSGQNQRRW